MKKLMIAAAVVCAAAMSQAATVNWNSGANLTDSQGTKISAAGALTAAVYTMTAETYDKYKSMDGETLSKTIATAIDDGTFSKLGFTLDNSATSTYDKRGGGAMANVAGKTDYTPVATAYALIVYTDNNNDGWYMANAASTLVESAQAVDVGELATKLGGGDASRGATAWAQAVPEPTTGLLMLLGMAGLALRRRRA